MFSTTHHHAALSTDFGLSWATKLFGAEAIASLPVLKAGPNKGKPKGYVIWNTTRTKGYDRATSSAYAEGQLVDAWIGSGYITPRSDALMGQWLGRMQSLGASARAGHFFDEGRAKHAAEQAWIKANQDAEYAEYAAERAAAKAAA